MGRSILLWLLGVPIPIIKNILEATHLIKQGRLKEATALSCRAPLKPADAAGGQGEMRGSILDMMPPQAAGRA
jgi:hypothetical protein